MPELDAVAEVAESIGCRAGVEFETVEILASEHRTVVRLQPAPFVIKIAPASDYPSLERELAVARNVAAAGGPASPPSTAQPLALIEKGNTQRRRSRACRPAVSEAETPLS